MPKSCHPEEEVVPSALDPERVEADCDMEFVRTGGPGGQHRNRRETGVRLTHRPTGIVAGATERRSQSQNRALALERMIEKLEKRRSRPKRRKKTKKPRGVKARDLEAKRKASDKKRARREIPT